MVTINNEEYLTGSEAAAYLADRWNIPSYSTEAFRVLRFRMKLQPDIDLPPNTTLWKKETLDQVQKPDRSKPRGKREKKNGNTA